MSEERARDADLDEFLQSLDEEETRVERHGRHYAEGGIRFATVTALTNLTKTVATIARMQIELTADVRDLTKGFASASKDVSTMKVWIEGSVSDSGVREPGMIDHVGVFRRWKNWVIALLSVIAVGSIASAATNLLTQHAITLTTTPLH